METERKCVDCGAPLAYWRGRPAIRCGECARGRRRVKQRPPVTCLDCAVVFTPPGQTGRAPLRCVACSRIRQRRYDAAKAKAWRDANPDRTRSYHKRQYDKAMADPAKRQAKRDRHLSKYGITRAELDVMLEAQGGGCAICGSEKPNGHGFRLHVDHCHETNRIRGLLCSKCNTMLGLADDDPARLRAAAQYLHKT